MILNEMYRLDCMKTRKVNLNEFYILDNKRRIHELLCRSQRLYRQRRLFPTHDEKRLQTLNTALGFILASYYS